MASSSSSSSSWKGKAYKTQSGQRQNVDRAEDQELKMLDYGWMGSYKQRALCVRILCPEKKHSSSYMDIKSVKFITRDENSHIGPSYTWHKTEHLTHDGFFEVLNLHVPLFKCHDIECEYWSTINNWVKLMDYKYETIGSIDQWTSRSDLTRAEMEKELEKMSLDQKTYLSTFAIAFKGDMKNGDGKDWMLRLVQNLLLMSDEFSSVNEILGVIPTTYSSSNSTMEIIYGQLSEESTRLEYDAPFYCSSIVSPDISSSCISSTGDSPITSATVVPDFCLALPDYPGIFPLVVEFKPAGKETPGRVQNIRQMLTRMFYQDVIFGLVVSPMLFEMSVIIKKDGKLNFARSGPQLFISEKDRVAGDMKLDVKILNALCSFVYGILKWAKQTKCQLP